MTENYIQIICLLWAVNSIAVKLFGDQLARLADNDKAFIRLLAEMLTCSKCFAFWFSFALTLDPLDSGVIAFGVMVITSIEQLTPQRI